MRGKLPSLIMPAAWADRAIVSESLKSKRAEGKRVPNDPAFKRMLPAAGPFLKVGLMVLNEMLFCA